MEICKCYVQEKIIDGKKYKTWLVKKIFRLRDWWRTDEQRERQSIKQRGLKEVQGGNNNSIENIANVEKQKRDWDYMWDI